MKNKILSSFLIRYGILLILGLFNLAIIYSIAYPLTVQASYYAISLFYDVSLTAPNTFTVSGVEILLINACIAGSAYYLLLILNISSKMEHMKRIKSLLFLLIVFFVVNVLRITLFTHLFVIGFEYFDLTHLFIWNFMSVIFVVCIWFLNVYIFNIHSIPFYDDFKILYKELRKK